ncbi:2-C-methyl-D-erythritol 4-phosphate cytidylyltransferase [Candidatus Riesia pediculischaeffi PTSU]|uniref:2-C-methyl-D-erythritol 4-phosphate cytidylyltransferase n=2 Tax=Candidatus Riesia pediculischaeffi TaxID=428411 RepID=A0A0C1SAL6_9ENTR|nr:2-C-methyl-D-erythritol 4-phosphate cytidylyltransferase [Candidatus Riesia pediculischaeffi PTSU]
MMLKNHPIKIAVVIPAAGRGVRMNLGFPKQYCKIGEKTMIEHTLSIFLDRPEISKIIVCIMDDDYLFRDLNISREPCVQVVVGGKKRVYSVLSGLNHLLKSSFDRFLTWVIIHDASRPCLRRSDLEKVVRFIFKNAGSTICGGILANPVINTIKRSTFKSGNIIEGTLDRKYLWNAMTPQFFPLYLIQKCIVYSLSRNVIITDDSSAMELCGYHPEIIVGQSDNLKVTIEEDLKLAHFYLYDDDRRTFRS